MTDYVHHQPPQQAPYSTRIINSDGSQIKPLAVRNNVTPNTNRIKSDYTQLFSLKITSKIIKLYVTGRTSMTTH